MSVNERSVSRGRQVFSTGRGGVGNIRPPSVSGARLESGPESGPDDFSVTRGREAICHPTKVFSTGRGGVGNIRSPSRDNQKVSTIEEDIIKKYKESQDLPVSSGRGGLGNINRSRTRDPIRVIPTVDSIGEGGVGSIAAENGSVAESIHMDDIKDEEYHSTGRGGNPNITIKHEPPPIEPHQDIGDDQSIGRGGAGKVVKETT